MALLFMDGFDHYATTNIQDKWTTNGGVDIQPGQGRNGGAAMRTLGNANYAAKGLPTTSNVMTVGVAVRMLSLQPYNFLNLSEGLGNHIGVGTDAGGTVYVSRQSGSGFDWSIGTILTNTLAGVLQTNVWAHIQVKILCLDAAGTVDLRVNGVLLASHPSTDTRTGGLGQLNTVKLGQGNFGGASNYFDDLYVCDGVGPAPWNSFLGDCRVDARFPTANGTSVGWTPSTGTNWDCVNDPLPNSDTDYNSASNPGLTDTFITQDVPSGGSIVYGVQQTMSIRKTDVGAASIAPVIRIGGVDYVGANQQPAQQYTMLTQVQQASPATGLQWTESEFNAAEFGYKRTV